MKSASARRIAGQADRNRRPVPAHPRRRARGARLPAGGARDRRDAAVADRPRDRGRRSSCCSARRWPGRGGARSTSWRRRPGKIVPSGRTKVIQPFETGVVRAIQVQDGQAVKAGDVLIELDPTMNAAERDHLQNDLLAEQLNVARLRAALAAGDDPCGRLRRRLPVRTRSWSARSASCCSTRSPSTAPRSPRSTRQQAQKEAEQATIGGHHPQARGDDPGRPAARRHPQDADGEGTGLEAHLFRDPAAAGRTAGGAQRPEEPSARSGGGGGGDPRDARPGGRRIPARRCRTNSPRPSRRRAGWRRT